MAGYTKVNLKDDVEDQAPKFGMSPELEVALRARPAGAREARASATSGSPRASGSPSATGTREQEEVYVIVSGSARHEARRRGGRA